MKHLFPWKICMKAALFGAASVIVQPWHIILSQAVIFAGIAWLFALYCRNMNDGQEENAGNMTDERFRKLSVICSRKPWIILILISVLSQIPLSVIPSEYAAGAVGVTLLVLSCFVQTFLTAWALIFIRKRNLYVETLFIALILAAFPGFLIEKLQVICSYSIFWKDIISGVIGASFFCGFCGLLAFSAAYKFPAADSKHKWLLQSAVVLAVCLGLTFAGISLRYRVMEANEVSILIHQPAADPGDFAGLQGSFYLAGMELNFTGQKISQRALKEIGKEELRHGKSNIFTVAEENLEDKTRLHLIDGKNPDVLLDTACKPGNGMWYWADNETMYFWRDPAQGIVSCFNGQKRTVRDLPVSPEQFQFRRDKNGNVLLIAQGSFYLEDRQGTLTPLSFKLPDQFTAAGFCRAAELSEDQNFLVCDYLFSRGRVPFRMILCVNLQNGKFRFYAPFELETLTEENENAVSAADPAQI